MRLTQLLIGLAVILLLAIAGFAAGDKATTSEVKELKPQTVCPVMGGKIDSTQYTDIQGQRVYHCCGGCAAKLKADPDKYFRKAAAAGVLFENIQTACPVTGKAFDKSIYTDYEGRRVYFATDDAKAKFAKKPAKYLAVLDEQVKSDAKVEKTSEHSSHEGHSGGAMMGGCGGH